MVNALVLCNNPYEKRLKECEQQSTLMYNSGLHEALLRKNGVAVWKCWRARFEHSGKCVEVDKCIDSDIVAGKFASHFFTAYTPNNAERANRISEEYSRMRASYNGSPLIQEHEIDTALLYFAFKMVKFLMLLG